MSLAFQRFQHDSARIITRDLRIDIDPHRLGLSVLAHRFEAPGTQVVRVPQATTIQIVDGGTINAAFPGALGESIANRFYSADNS